MSIVEICYRLTNDHVLFRHPALDSQLTKDRHKAEVRALLRCKQIGVRRLCDEYG